MQDGFWPNPATSWRTEKTMTIPRITSLLIMLALGHDARALQMGQISSVSVRGQPLTARVTLYGMSPTTNADLSAELLPAFGAPADSLSNLDMHARIESNERGVQAIVITSGQAYELAMLAVRVRLWDGAHAMLRYYELNIPAAPTPRAARSARQVRASSAPIAPRTVTHRALDDTSTMMGSLTSGNYGPVRTGQSLWSILQETRLAHGDNRVLMHDIVAANPQAFVGADPTRLRVGAMLQLPGGTPIANTAPATVTNRVARVDKDVTDAKTAARLDRLAVQFAEIRARYAKQKQNETSALPTSATNVIPTETTKRAPIDVAAGPAPIALPSPAQPRPTVMKSQSAHSDNLLDTLETYVDGKVLDKSVKVLLILP